MISEFWIRGPKNKFEIQASILFYFSKIEKNNEFEYFFKIRTKRTYFVKKEKKTPFDIVTLSEYVTFY